MILHVYSAGESSVVRGINALLKQIGTGAFHCGIEVYDLEWSFADTSMYEDEPELSVDLAGIFHSQPMHAEGHTFCESLDLGYTYRPEDDVFRVINRLEEGWSGDTYDVLEKNCCHFCAALARELGVRDLPRWVMSLASGAAVVVTGIEDMMARRERFANQIADSVGCAYSNHCCAGGDGALVEKIEVEDEGTEYAEAYEEATLIVRPKKYNAAHNLVSL